MTMEIKRQIRVTPQVGYAPYSQVHAHSTGNDRSTAQNESDFMNRKDLNSGYYTHVVGNGQIIQTAEVGRGAYDVCGGWNYETYAAVELIQSHANKAEFDRDYRLYVNLLRQLAKEAGIPCTLDTHDLAGIKTHMFCTYNQPGNASDHIDPYPYLNKWGITVGQFERDLATGFENGVSNSNSIEKPKQPIEKDDEIMFKYIKVLKNGHKEQWFAGQGKRMYLPDGPTIENIDYLLNAVGRPTTAAEYAEGSLALKAIETMYSDSKTFKK